MRYISLLVQTVLFLLTLTFVLLNTSMVTVNYGFGQWTTPLPWLLLLMLAVGVVFGALAMSGSWWRAARKAAQLEKNCQTLRSSTSESSEL